MRSSLVSVDPMLNDSLVFSFASSVSSSLPQPCNLRTFGIHRQPQHEYISYGDVERIGVNGGSQGNIELRQIALSVAAWRVEEWSVALKSTEVKSSDLAWRGAATLSRHSLR